MDERYPGMLLHMALSLSRSLVLSRSLSPPLSPHLSLCALNGPNSMFSFVSMSLSFCAASLSLPLCDLNGPNSIFSCPCLFFAAWLSVGRYEEAERIEELLKSGALGGGQQNVSEKEAVAA